MMNYCTRCACHFTAPGTCNCFAPVRDASPIPLYAPPTFVPYAPYRPTTTGTPLVPPPMTTITSTPWTSGAVTITYADIAHMHKTGQLHYT